MELISIIILGIIQGIAEFLPISSSAHLIIFRDLFGIGSYMGTNVELTFDIALHLGTLLAILVFFYKDFIGMISNGLTKGVKDKKGRLLWYLAAATVPAGIIGVLFEDIIDSLLRKNYLLIACSLFIMGIIIYFADKVGKKEKDVLDITLKDALIIGCSQVFALIPGFSRSGTTIATGRVLGIKRDDAAKFSFFLSAPVVGGAVCIKLLKKSTWLMIQANIGIFLIGILSAFITGLICIKFLLKYLDSHDFKAFMIYRIILAVVVVITILIK